MKSFARIIQGAELFIFLCRVMLISAQEVMNLLISVSEVSARLGLRQSQIYVLVRKGLLPAVHFGRTVRFDPQELERFISAGGRRQGGPPSGTGGDAQ